MKPVTQPSWLGDNFLLSYTVFLSDNDDTEFVIFISILFDLSQNSRN